MSTPTNKGDALPYTVRPNCLVMLGNRLIRHCDNETSAERYCNDLNAAFEAGKQSIQVQDTQRSLEVGVIRSELEYAKNRSSQLSEHHEVKDPELAHGLAVEIPSALDDAIASLDRLGGQGEGGLGVPGAEPPVAPAHKPGMPWETKGLFFYSNGDPTVGNMGRQFVVEPDIEGKLFFEDTDELRQFGDGLADFFGGFYAEKFRWMTHEQCADDERDY